MTDQQPHQDLRSRWRVLKADVAHFSDRLDQLARDLTPGPDAPTGPQTPPQTAEPLDQAEPGQTDPGAVITELQPGPSIVTSSWQQMPAALAAQAWPQLLAWVDALIDRYELHEQLPACWYRHGAMVEELHALHVAWIGAYIGFHALPTAAADWHDHLDRVLARIRGWDIRGCASGQHRGAPAPPVDPHVAVDRAEYIQADVQRRAELEQAAAQPQNA